MEFLGYPRPDGTVGTRNYILIISTGPGVNRLCDQVAGSVAGTVPVPACLEEGIWREHVGSLAANPNVAGAVVVEPSPEGGGADVAGILSSIGKPAEVVTVASLGGYIEAGARAVRTAMTLVREASTMRRQGTLISRLITGVGYRDISGTGDLIYHCSTVLVENNARVVLAKGAADKKDRINSLSTAGMLPAGGRVGKDRGIYEVAHSENPGDVLAEMASKGVQVVVWAGGSSLPAAHSILPVINITAQRDYYEKLKDCVEMDLSGLNYENYRVEDFSLLLVNEIISTASGKLTSAEILKMY